MNREELQQFILSLKGIKQDIKKKLIASFLMDNPKIEKILSDLKSYKEY